MTKFFAITVTENDKTLYVEPADVGCINWTLDPNEARVWTSQPLPRTWAG